jgi:pectate disaccharide-lyase
MNKKLLKLFSTILLFPLFAISQIYVSPTGIATNDGTLGNPTTLLNAINIVNPGQTIYMRGGTYAISSTILIARTNSGSAGNLKHLEAYTGETPIVDFSAQAELPANRGFILDGFYWYFKGITIKNSGDNGMLLSGSNNIIDNCIFEKNRDTGLQLSRYNVNATLISQWPSNNLILNCESFDNKDIGAENADGFAAKLTCGEGNIFRGCISHNNIDDGWDLFTKPETGPIGIVLFENCVAYNNGTLTTAGTSGSGDKNGFKLGGEGIAVNHILRRCVAFGNGHHGFTDNNNLGSIEMSNNTSVNNADTNYSFRTGGTHQFRNNVSYNSINSDKYAGTDVNFSNVWWVSKKSTNGKIPAIVVSADDFVSLTVPVVIKNADGSPNLGDFAKLNLSSDFIDRGEPAAGISYNGTAPDLGARETGPIQTTDFTLSALASPITGGTISINPNNATYNAGTVVTLTATPAADYVFVSWSNGATTAITTVTMDANKTITANFKSTLRAAYVLTTAASPINGGTIAISPDKQTYTEGEMVTLTATPASGYVFTNWSNEATTATITVAMTSNLSLTGIFSLPVTGTQTLKIEESAAFTSGYCKYEGQISSNTGADNGNVTNLSNSAGKGVNYTVKVPTAGVYSIVFRYVNSSSSNATTAKLIINGTDAIASFSFPKTANSTTFTTTTPTNITLVKGVNTIRLETTVASAFADIDWMAITGDVPEAESCSSLPSTASLGVNNFEAAVFEAIVSPNPTVAAINLLVSTAMEEEVVITLTDLNGRVILSKKQILDSGQNVIKIDNSISKGFYIVTVQSDDVKKSIKVIVK